MAWKSIYQERSRYRDRDRRVVGEHALKSLPGWVNKLTLPLHIFGPLRRPMPAGSADIRLVCQGRGEDESRFEEVKACGAKCPTEQPGDFGYQEFWSRAASQAHRVGVARFSQVTSVFGWRPTRDSAVVAAPGIDIEAR